MSTKVANINIYELSYILAVMETIAIVRMMKVEKSNINILYPSILLDYIFLSFTLAELLIAFSSVKEKRLLLYFFGGLLTLSCK